MGETDLVEKNQEFKIGYVRFREAVRYVSQNQRKDSSQTENQGNRQCKDGN